MIIRRCCEECVDGQRMEGKVTNRYANEKERKTQTESWDDGEYLQKACKEEKKNEGKKKRGRKMEMLEGRDTMGSVFILVQVSLLIEVFIIWRCKAFLCCVENVNYPAENGVVFTLVLLADQLDIP